MDPLAQHPCAETARCGANDLAWEDELNSIGSTQVKVIANDFLEELTAGLRTIDDLGEAEFHLPDGESIVVASSMVLRTERHRQSVQPFLEEGLDLLRT